MPNKVPFGEKGFEYFVGYKHAKKIKPFGIFLPKMSVCIEKTLMKLIMYVF